MGSVALRRTKDQKINGRPLVSLPSKTVHLVEVELSNEDRRVYDR